MLYRSNRILVFLLILCDHFSLPLALLIAVRSPLQANDVRHEGTEMRRGLRRRQGEQIFREVRNLNLIWFPG